MALSPIYRDPVFRNFLTFDLEWKRGEKEGDYYYPRVTLVGVFDGIRYRHYSSVKEFLRRELTRENRGKWFYAHAGGIADMNFLFQEFLEDQGYKVDASFSGASAMIVRVYKGGHQWVFVDSYRLLPDKLANIAKFVGMAKGDVDFETDNLLELIEYNELDCSILWHAINSFETVLRTLGGQLQMTLASSAMYLFRKKYLARTIDTSDNVNEAARQSYIASRVEIFKRECQQAVYYDINSSFPHAMTYPSPGNLKCSRKTLPGHDMVIADCEIEVPDSYFPPLPYRAKNRKIYFPTGSWRCWFTGVDLRLLEELGGRILKVYEVMEFFAFDDLRDFAQDLYEKRLSSKDDMSKLVLKLLLNSLYGKFGESSEKTRVICFPDEPIEGDNVSMLYPGVFLIDEEVQVNHAHVPISAHITARARESLYRYMERGAPFYYCDTDGFACDSPDLPVEPGLGGLKREMLIREGRFYRPKVYELLSESNERRVKAKGFTLRPENELRHSWPESERDSLEKEYTYQRFTELVNGHGLETRRFYRIRELLRKDDEYRPTEAVIRKKLQNESPKRCFNGIDSRPWDVKEIEQ